MCTLWSRLRRRVIDLAVSGYVSSILAEQFTFNEGSQHHDGLVVLVHCRLDFGRINGDTVVNAIMKGEMMTLEFEFPVYRIEIVFFVGKLDAETIGKNGGHFVEPLQPAVIGDHRFGAS